MLQNARGQGYSFYCFWVKGKSTGEGGGDYLPFPHRLSELSELINFYSPIKLFRGGEQKLINSLTLAWRRSLTGWFKQIQEVDSSYKLVKVNELLILLFQIILKPFLFRCTSSSVSVLLGVVIIPRKLMSEWNSTNNHCLLIKIWKNTSYKRIHCRNDDWSRNGITFWYMSLWVSEKGISALNPLKTIRLQNFFLPHKLSNNQISRSFTWKDVTTKDVLNEIQT